MEIRQFEERDRPEVVALWNTALFDPAPHNEPQAAIDRKLAVGDGLFFVAIEEGRLIGTVMGGYDGHRGWIYSVAVAEDQRRRGVATALIRRIEEELAALGCPKVNLQIRAGNEAVTAFYEHVGYAVEPRVSMGKVLTEVSS